MRHSVLAAVKRLRPASYYEYELDSSQMNHQLSDVETLFVAADPVYSYLASTQIKKFPDTAAISPVWSQTRYSLS